MTRKCKEEIEKINRKEKQLKGKRLILLRKWRIFQYEIGMTKEEMIEKVKEMITHMKTRQFWLEHGGHALYFVEGGQLMRKYLDMTGSKRREKGHANCTI